MEDYKEKYEQALERARNIRFGNPQSGTANVVCEEIFPELKDSEDERIRKQLLNWFKDCSWDSIDDGKLKREDIVTWLEKQGEQKPAWSKKDEIALDDALWCCKQAASIAKDENDMGNVWYAERWLKSLKDRVGCETNCTTTKEWSKEDEKAINDIMWIIEAYRENGFNESHKQIANNAERWLKSLRPQNTTVTDEELAQAKKDAYNDALDKIEYHSGEPTFDDGWSAAIDFFQKKSLTPQSKQEFSEGDWITMDNPCQIISIEGNYIVQYCDDEKTREISKKFCESHFHLWTIQDAKDGDVLATHLSPEGNWIGIYKESVDILGFKTYCFLNGVGEFVINPNRCRNHGTYGLHPATKEQCDILFSKMKEAGYEWDADKKELKKLVDNDEYHAIPLYKSEKELEQLKQNEKKLTWSEKDELQMQGIIDLLPGLPIRHSWLKSIRQRLKGE